MSKNNYEVINFKGHSFFFKYENDSSDLLHIWVRHLKNPIDAIRIFFNGNSTYNSKYKRFETIFGDNEIYWLWLDEINKKVLIISCFTKGD